MANVVSVATEVVDTVNVTVVEPAATVTKLGTEAAGFEVVRLTVTPPAGAAFASVIVPTDCVPPGTVDGDNERVNVPGTPIVNAADLVVPLPFAVMVAVAATLTEFVETVKVAVLAPAGTVTVAGTEAVALSVESVTT